MTPADHLRLVSQLKYDNLNYRIKKDKLVLTLYRSQTARAREIRYLTATEHLCFRARHLGLYSQNLKIWKRITRCFDTGPIGSAKARVTATLKKLNADLPALYKLCKKDINKRWRYILSAITLYCALYIKKYSNVIDFNHDLLASTLKVATKPFVLDTREWVPYIIWTLCREPPSTIEQPVGIEQIRCLNQKGLIRGDSTNTANLVVVTVLLFKEAVLDLGVLDFYTGKQLKAPECVEQEFIAVLAQWEGTQSVGSSAGSTHS